MPKATDADKERFRSLVPAQPGVEVKPMFGQLGAFVNGNMFAGLFGDGVGVKVDEAARADLEAMGAGPFGPQERPMPGYLTLPRVPRRRGGRRLGGAGEGARGAAPAQGEEAQGAEEGLRRDPAPSATGPSAAGERLAAGGPALVVDLDEHEPVGVGGAGQLARTHRPGLQRLAPWRRSGAGGRTCPRGPGSRR